MVGTPELFPKYCIDTSSIINLMPPYKKDVYRRDVFPTLWKKLEYMITENKLISPIEVYKEIEEGKDELYEWCKKNKKMFKDIDDCQIQKLSEVENHYDRDYWNRESIKGHWADPWVLALSICENAIIVTDEKNTPNRIPFIAERLNIKCLGIIDFFREIGVKY